MWRCEEGVGLGANIAMVLSVSFLYCALYVFLYYTDQAATTTAITVTAEATVSMNPSSTQPGLLVHHTTYHA